MHDITQNIAEVRQRICTEAEKNRRKPQDITLLAVSKTRSSNELRTAFAAGQHCFGENYLQEAQTKISELQDLTISWHFIGPIQSNKTAAIAQSFDWVHSVDRLKIAQRLSDQRAPSLPALNICLQVNISNETNKSGVTPEELVKLAANVATLPQLTLRGLMAIPKATTDTMQQRRNFAKAQELFVQLQQITPTADTLSIGMSNDMEQAIAEGSTMVRIGTDIFGPRN